MMNQARRIVKEYHNARAKSLGKNQIELQDIFVVWFCKTLQNWKALVSTTQPGGVYYEITHNGDKNETYVDVYMKFENFKVLGDWE
jgi:hypothetical protein